MSTGTMGAPLNLFRQRWTWPARALKVRENPGRLPMKTLTRPEGTKPEDLNLSRRGLAGAVFGGYAVFAFSADAAPITTDAAGLVTETVQMPVGDGEIPAFVARPNAKGRFP